MSMLDLLEAVLRQGLRAATTLVIRSITHNVSRESGTTTTHTLTPWEEFERGV